jgi:hypothetical protein
VASCGHSLHRDCLRFYGWAWFLFFFVLLDLRSQNYTVCPCTPYPQHQSCVDVCLSFKQWHGLINIPCT